MHWWLLSLFVCLILLNQWIMRHVQGVGYLLTGDGQVALVLYSILVFPGVFVHEVSHVVLAWLLRVQVRRLSFGIRRKASGSQAALGSVDIASTDPIRASLIGLAPLAVGCTCILLIADRALGFRTLATFSLTGFWSELRHIGTALDSALWLYVILAIGNAMLPSAADRQAWAIALVFVAFLGALAFFSGLFAAVSTPLRGWLATAANQLTYAFAVAVAVDLAFAVALFMVERGLALLGFGRLRYR